ncbi:hypothetical protein TH53_09425 [Pedobacter lusitanus]|uniref:5'-nucleotidase n=1 Tax=Pedobacter lusitanus TaxID=1503925 RepID=A0A0D0F775_9SPHI|nr:hypothetical protein [Pedobacter lusitanus]KIO77478.1 hypothetical protein TH53_09425 [Pedobacter lusitanus]
MSNRRSFLKNSTLVAAATLFSKPITSLAHISKTATTLQQSAKQVIIYHSSQLNGHLPDQQMKHGGINNIKKLLNNQDTGGLILDAGNFLGNGRDNAQHHAVIVAMNAAGYHASTPSVQDLSQGEAYLAALTNQMNFCLVNCNYRFKNPRLAAVVKPWQIINFGKFKIGVTGVGPEINGIGYQDPVKKASEIAKQLINELNCDLVICLSGLDYLQKNNVADNTTLAQQSELIDFIISANTHQKKTHTMVLKNATGHDVFIGHSQANGLNMGKMSFQFQEKQKFYAENSQLINSNEFVA